MSERNGIPAPGFSDRVNDPELLAALARQKKSAGKFALFLIPLPLIGFAVYGAMSDGMELTAGLLIGAAVSVVFLLFYLYTARKERAENTYDAVVTGKKTFLYHPKNAANEKTTRREYVTYVQTDDGRKKKIVEREGQRLWAWEYLHEGERFRCHPQFAFPYELYDKSKADCLYCVICQKKNPVEADRCPKCGAPLLK